MTKRPIDILYPGPYPIKNVLEMSKRDLVFKGNDDSFMGSMVTKDVGH